MNIISAMETSAIEATHAFVIYRERNGESQRLFSTLHPIETIQGKPTLMPGKLLDQSDLQILNDGMNQHDNALRWIDEKIIAMGDDRMIWYTPAGNRPMFFDSTSFVKPACKGQGILPVPGLVWMVFKNELYVYATRCMGRPTLDATLYQAPLFNVWSHGKVCIGTAERPADHQKWDTSAWEQMFFCSRFTHPNFTQKNRLMVGDPARFWSGKLKKPGQKFPDNKLVPLAITLSQLGSANLREVLDGIHGAAGEF